MQLTTSTIEVLYLTSYTSANKLKKNEATRMSWTNILARILDGERDILSPFHKEGYLKPLFIITDRKTRKGYGYILCNITRKGIWLSSMIIPDKPNIGWVYNDELTKFSPLHFELKDFNKFSPEMGRIMER